LQREVKDIQQNFDNKVDELNSKLQDGHSKIQNETLTLRTNLNKQLNLTYSAN